MVGALIPFGFAVGLIIGFDNGVDGLQYVTDDAWIEPLGIRYKLGLDGLNLWLIGLTTLLFAAAAVWMLLRPVARPRLFAFHLALAETAVLGAVPRAGPRAVRPLLRPDAGAVLLPRRAVGLGPARGGHRGDLQADHLHARRLAADARRRGRDGGALGRQRGGSITFVLSDLAKADLSESTQRWIFVTFALAFLIKMPAFPFHAWMPDAYRTMPLPALAIFSGVLSKVAAYGFLRIVLPLFPAAAQDYQTLILVLALCSIVYGSAQAFTQTNARLVLGYSSIAQLGFIVLGIFAFDPEGRGGQGAVLQMVNHGLVVAPLFFIIALLAERVGRVRGHPRHGRPGLPGAGAARRCS